MEIPYSRWYPAIPHRRSRRSYDSADLGADEKVHLRDICTEFSPYAHARAVFLDEPPDRLFRGAIGPYGKVKGARVSIAFVGDMRDANVQEMVGYQGEGVILEVTAMGFASCWVGGFFRPGVAASLAGATSHERVLAVTPVGRAPAQASMEESLMTGFGLTHRRRPLVRLVSGMKEQEWPGWTRAALEAARIAPSAVNRQPWRFHVEPNAITVSVDSRPAFDFAISKRLDCGIAMLHIEVAALAHGVRGRWEFLNPPAVARFIATSGA